MKMNLIYSRTYFEAFKGVCKLIENQLNMNEKNILIVPDRFTLSAEKYVMETLKLDSVFNFKVATLNLLANEICPVTEYLDNDALTMLTNKVLHNIDDKLTVFKGAKNLKDFSRTCMELISQLKSSQVTAKDFSQAEFLGTEYEKLKKQDLSLIYTEYENYLLNTGVDSVKKFDMFIENISKCNEFLNANIYFANFFSFTNQGYAIIEQFAKIAKSVTIGVCLPKENQNNQFIYSFDMKNSLINLAQKNKIPLFQNYYNDSFMSNVELVENLWGINKSKANKEIPITCCDNLKSQYLQVAQKINEKIIYGGAKYSDFNIVVNNLENCKLQIERVFKDFNINYFVDLGMSLSLHPFIKFLENLFDVITSNFDRKCVIEFSKSFFAYGTNEEKNNFEYFCERYNIKHLHFLKKQDYLMKVEEYSNFYEFSCKLFEVILNFKSKFNVKNDLAINYVNAIKELINCDEIKEKTTDFLKFMENNNNVIFNKFNEKVFDKLDVVLNNVEKVLQNQEISFSEFVNILNSGLSSCSISIVPLAVDSVFIGDSSSSFFVPKKYTYYLNANINTYPTIRKDNGIFTDRDIINSKTIYKIDPTIKELNKREKLKLLSNISLNDFEILYSKDVSEEPSGLVNEIMTIYTNTKIKNESTINEINPIIASGNNQFLETLISNFNEEKINEDDFNLVKNLDEKFKDKINQINAKYFQQEGLENEKLKDFFFKDEKFSISQIESFYNCPYKHFLEYGLKIKPLEKSDLSKREIGNIIHEVCSLSVDYLENNDPKVLGEKLFDTVIKQEKYYALVKSSQNATLLTSLRKECGKIVEAIEFHIKNSGFTKHFKEKRFYQNFYEIYNKIMNENINQNLSLTGAVDRIDYDDKNFMILDYKTGSTKIGYSDIYYGKKLQLFTYLIMLENNSKKIFNSENYLSGIGAFYMPIKNKIIKENEDKFAHYKLNGIYSININELAKIDKLFLVNEEKSRVFEEKIKFDENGINFDKDTYALTEKEFIKLKKLVLKNIHLGIQNILNGFIIPICNRNSNKQNCDYCNYSTICKSLNSVKTRTIKEIRKEQILT